MELTDFTKGKLWAIRPEYLTEMMVKIPDLKSAVDAKGIEFTEDPEVYGQFKLQEGVAVIPISGPITKKRSIYSFLFGGTSLAELTGVFKAALDDNKVDAILLDIDSPGGTVSGTEAFSDLVYDARDVKPVVAFGNGMMASAAYWIGSGAQKIIVERSAEVGSIGVVMVHHDWSAEDAMMGLKRTVLSAGKYKALGNDAEPLSDLAREVFQSELDYLYSLFVDTVARNRGVAVGYVLEYMADGKVFIGQQAVDAGLADDTGGMEAAIEAAVSLVKGNTPSIAYSVTKTNIKEEDIMKIETVQELKKAYPDLSAKLIEEGAAGVNQDDIRSGAAAAEKDRILGLAIVQFGEETGDKFKAIVESGVSVDQFKAIQATLPKPAAPAAETGQEATAVAQAKNEMLEAMHQAAPENPGANNGTQQTEKNFMTLVKEYQSVHKCGRVAAMQEVMKEHPEAHTAYLKSVN